MNRLTTATAAFAVAMWLGGMAAPGSAAVVTVMSGPNPGVVFDSGGFENQSPGSLGSPAVGTYSLVLAGTGANSTATVVTGPAGAGSVPQSAYSGSNYLALARNTGTVYLGSDFSRSIDLATESFTIEYAFWGTANATAFAVGNNIAGATVGTANVLAGWRYNPTLSDLGQYLNSVQDDDPANDQLLPLNYIVGDWNRFSYSWDAGTQSGTYTLNGGSAPAIARVSGAGSSQAAPTTVNRFFASPGAANTVIWMDAIPEPSSAVVIGLAGAAMLARRRRA
jgi:hypothetical protein